MLYWRNIHGRYQVDDGAITAASMLHMLSWASGMLKGYQFLP